MSSKLAGGTTAARSGLGPSGPTSKGLHGGLSKRTGGSKSSHTSHTDFVLSDAPLLSDWGQKSLS